MANFSITYTRGDSQRALAFEAYNVESEGEALELFDEYSDGLDDCVELVSIKEVEE